MYSEEKDIAAKTAGHLMEEVVDYSDIAAVVVRGKIVFDTRAEMCLSVLAAERKKAVEREATVLDSDGVEAVVVSVSTGGSSTVAAGDPLQELLSG